LGLEDPIYRIALVTIGIIFEGAFSLGVYAALGYVAGATIGASGAIISRMPRVGPLFEAGGAKALQILNSSVGQAALTLLIVIAEGIKVTALMSIGTPRWEIFAEAGIDMSKLFGGAYGFSGGLSYGKQIPTKVEQLVEGMNGNTNG